MGDFQLDEACLRVGRRVEHNLNNGKDAFEGFDTGYPSTSSGQRSTSGRYQSVKGARKRTVKVKWPVN